MKLLVLIGGAYHLGFAIFHLAFWKLFRWRTELPRLGVINRGVMQILNLCLTFVFLAFAWISLFHADALLGSALGRTLLAIIALFWLLRAVEQLVFFGVRNAVSFAFFVAFLGGAALYAIPWFAASP